ncbi:MAG: HAD-IIB family hydrolase [Comamonas sp.]
MAAAPAPDRLRPLAEWPARAAAGIAGVLTDIDDTLTTDGVVPASTLAALAALKAAGLAVIAITGRPVGWSLPFAASWPIDAIVAENGAVALQRQADASVRKHYLEADAATRRANHARLQRVARDILAHVPGAALAHDSAGRETDIAIDHGEHHHLPAEHIEAVAARMRAAGLKASVSSIHINGWLGEHDKLHGARWALGTLLGRDLDREMARWVYIGDSPNDQRMFEAFAHSVGVANIARFVPQLTHLPRYVTLSPRGQGFEELARAILAGHAPGIGGEHLGAG